MDQALVILAAGMGSRFGGLKQIASINETGESIIDYSVYDAHRSGFNKVILVIRPEIEDEIKEFFGNRLNDHIDVQYVHQSQPDNIAIERKKPLGTAQALLSVREYIDGPFAIINADDFYGLEAFKKADVFLRSSISASSHAVIGYELKQTLSKHGAVSRAECRIDLNNRLVGVRELHEVYEEENKIFYILQGSKQEIAGTCPVSMNFWCFHPSIFQHIESDLMIFLQNLPDNPGSEFLIPDVVNRVIDQGHASFEVLPTRSTWFGITYKEDFQIVYSGIQDLTNSGLYSSPLWN